MRERREANIREQSRERLLRLARALCRARCDWRGRQGLQCLQQPSVGLHAVHARPSLRPAFPVPLSSLCLDREAAREHRGRNPSSALTTRQRGWPTSRT
eukprot:9500140-Pyramimonas_sp.AAC.1